MPRTPQSSPSGLTRGRCTFLAVPSAQMSQVQSPRVEPEDDARWGDRARLVPHAALRHDLGNAGGVAGVETSSRAAGEIAPVERFQGRRLGELCSTGRGALEDFGPATRP